MFVVGFLRCVRVCGGWCVEVVVGLMVRLIR